MTETEVAFAPTRVGARRRRLPPVVVGLILGVLIVLAVAKPWGSAVDPAASPGASATGAAAVAARTPAPDGSSGSSATPQADAAPPAGAFPGPARPGAWGVSVGIHIAGDGSGAWANWSGWVPLEPVSEPPEPSVRDPMPTGTDCASVPTLPAAPTIVGITVPEPLSTDFSVVGWLSNGRWTAPLDGELARLDVPGRGQFAELASRDGRTFPDGRYDLRLLAPGHDVGLAFCLGSASPATGLDPAITGQIVTQLAARSGAWGVGVGGNGPRLIRDEPWTDWVAVEPVTDGGAAIGVWPDTGICKATPVLPNRPSLVAITVPPGLPPDWRLDAHWSDGPDIVALDSTVRQISPPGNRGISYLERVDRAIWPDGRYEFNIRTAQHVVSLTVCVGTP